MTPSDSIWPIWRHEDRIGVAFIEIWREWQTLSENNDNSHAGWYSSSMLTDLNSLRFFFFCFSSISSYINYYYLISWIILCCSDASPGQIPEASSSSLVDESRYLGSTGHIPCKGLVLRFWWVLYIMWVKTTTRTLLLCRQCWIILNLRVELQMSSWIVKNWKRGFSKII